MGFSPFVGGENNWALAQYGLAMMYYHPICTEDHRKIPNKVLSRILYLIFTLSGVCLTHKIF